MKKYSIRKGLGIIVSNVAREVRKDFRKSPIQIAFFASMMILVPLSISNSYKNERYDRELEQKVSITADANGNNDGATTSDEWAEVYKSLGLRYDVHNYKPLTIKQRKEYLEGHPLDDK